MVDAIAAAGLANRSAGEAGAWQAIAERATTVMLDEQDAGRLARLLKVSADLAGYTPTKQEQEQGGVSDLFASVPAGGLIMLVKQIGFDNNTYRNQSDSDQAADDRTIDSTATDAPDQGG
jgi:hypothetical protein